MKIGKGFTLAAEAAEDVIAIVGRRGRGKTNTAVVLVEELHADGARFCIADPVGVWWGLKSSRHGKAAGIPVVVMGGEHQDVPLEETAGRVIADFVADKHSPSVILDFRGFRKAQMARFMADFLEQLYQRNREALHLVLDEADQFAPQRVMGETARLVGAAEDVCKMGRARGLLPILITQRPAALNKNVLTQAGLLIAHQLTGPQDQKAVDEWIRANADEAERAEFMATIATLERGEAWFWQPELPIFKRVQVRERLTFDSSSTPQRGTRRAEPTTVAKVDLDALSEQIKATIERAKADDPRELRKRIAQLEREAARPAAAPTPAAPKVVERPCPVKAAHVKRIERAAGAITRGLAHINGQIQAQAEHFDKLQRALEDPLARVVLALRAAAVPAPKETPQREGRAAAGAPAPAASARPRPAAVARPVSSPGHIGLGKAQMRVLATLRDVGPLTRDDLGVFCAYRADTGGFGNVLSDLRAHHAFIETDHEGRNALTPAGASEAGYLPAFARGSDLVDVWLAKLSKAAALALKALIDVYPQGLTREELGERTGYRADTGGFGNALSELRSNGLASRERQLVVHRALVEGL